MTIYIYSSSDVSYRTDFDNVKSGCDDKELLDYIYENYNET